MLKTHELEREKEWTTGCIARTMLIDVITGHSVYLSSRKANLSKGDYFDTFKKFYLITAKIEKGLTSIYGVVEVKKPTWYSPAD